MTNNDLLLSKATKKSTDLFISNPSHALIIFGPMGSGRLSLASYIASQLVGSDLNKADLTGKIKTLGIDKKPVGIEDIRELKLFFRLKSQGLQSVTRVAIIEGNKISDEAQNSLLKLLEEPPIGGLIIITASSENGLRPTILSRSPKLSISKPSFSEASEYFMKIGYNPEEITKSYLLSSGTIGLMSDLLSKDDTESTLPVYIEEAKDLLKSTRLQKLSKIDEILKDKQNIADRLYALKRVIHAAMRQSIIASNEVLTKSLYFKLKAVDSAQFMVDSNVNLKLMLTNLLLNL